MSNDFRLIIKFLLMVATIVSGILGYKQLIIPNLQQAENIYDDILDDLEEDVQHHNEHNYHPHKKGKHHHGKKEREHQ